MSPLVRSLSAFFAASLLAVPVAAQQLYRSVGPDGRVQYSDRPPTDGKNVEKITSTRGSGPASAAPAAGDDAKAGAPKTNAEKEQAFRQRRIEAEEKARKDDKVAQDKTARTEACAAMRRQVAGMQSGPRVARLNERGETVFLEDTDIQQEIGRLQRDIAANCN